ncbi:MAG: DUF3795 domain-containing protein [Tannerellaceae bacterium]|jgi:hypothetical protein|nr:DUF3795 domain-containing protein [Tannerellaceae bacterium]
MNEFVDIAPCGVICNLCIAYQRDKNKCVGCNNVGKKPNHCNNCRIKNCENKSNKEALCNECSNFPCKRIKDLDKRYKIKYGESIIHNFSTINNLGMEHFFTMIEGQWKCNKCGNWLCVHREICLSCGANNPNFPAKPPMLSNDNIDITPTAK